MPEQLPSSFVTPDQKRSFPKAVTEGIFRSSKLRAKVKQLRRALSVKKKSVNLRSYSPIIFKVCQLSFLNFHFADGRPQVIETKDICFSEFRKFSKLTIETHFRPLTILTRNWCLKFNHFLKFLSIPERRLPW